MRRSLACGLSCLLLSGLAHAQSVNCASVPLVMPLSNALLVPVAGEWVTTSTHLGANEGVLAQAYDEAQSVDQVLLRMRIESCKSVAKAMPVPGAIDPLDPATYKPRTQFDNAPWRFNMSQNGKNMTADEFSAWMKSRGVRVARGASTPDAASASGASTTMAPPPGTEPGSMPVEQPPKQ